MATSANHNYDQANREINANVLSVVSGLCSLIHIFWRKKACNKYKTTGPNETN